MKKEESQYKKGGNWIQKAVNPSHVGYCSPPSKKTCTPKRKAFAMTMKKHHGFHQEGGMTGFNSGQLSKDVVENKKRRGL